MSDTEPVIPSEGRTAPTTVNANASSQTPSVPSPQDLVRHQAIAAIKQVFDPEIPVNIYELGLIYEVQVNDKLEVHVIMTLTAPSCPSAQTLPVEVKQVVETIPEVPSATVEVVWEPPWTKEMMSEDAQLQLGMF